MSACQKQLLLPVLVNIKNYHLSPHSVENQSPIRPPPPPHPRRSFAVVPLVAIGGSTPMAAKGITPE